MDASHSESNGSPRAAALMTALAAVLYVLFLPTGWTDRSPLLWDQAGHYLDALRIARGLAGGGFDLVGAALFGPDLYPPVHSALLGLWMLALGAGAASWLAFGMTVHCATTYALARIHPVAAGLFLASPMLGGLAPSLMVEPVACLLLVLTLAALPAEEDGPGRTTAFAALMSLTLLTKYNIGLPLVPAALAAVVVRPRRRYLVRVAGALAAALAVWALYLTVQHSGWSMFLRFAENRSDSAGMESYRRLLYYGRVLGWMFLPGAAPAVAGALIAIGGLVHGRRRSDQASGHDRRLLMAGAYVVFSLAVLSRHEYRLARNLVGPVVSFLAAVGWGLALLPTVRRRLAVGAVLLLFLAMPWTFSGPYRGVYVARFYPQDIRRLDGLSDACLRQMARPGRIRIVGTFNEFSPGWVKILELRRDPPPSLTVGATCPLPRSRTGYDPQWREAYADIVAGWARDGTLSVMAISVASDSPYHSRDYELWNAWKLNLLRALRESPAFVEDSGETLPSGVGYTVFVRTPAPSAP